MHVDAALRSCQQAAVTETSGRSERSEQRRIARWRCGMGVDPSMRMKATLVQRLLQAIEHAYRAQTQRASWRANAISLALQLVVCLERTEHLRYESPRGAMASPAASCRPVMHRCFGIVIGVGGPLGRWFRRLGNCFIWREQLLLMIPSAIIIFRLLFIPSSSCCTVSAPFAVAGPWPCSSSFSLSCWTDPAVLAGLVHRRREAGVTSAGVLAELG